VFNIYLFILQQHAKLQSLKTHNIRKFPRISRTFGCRYLIVMLNVSSIQAEESTNGIKSAIIIAAIVNGLQVQDYIEPAERG
jgi:hypothetical protein